jgi:hypothetical protein
MAELSPGVRRLCVCVGASQPGLLDAACRSGARGQLYTEHAWDEDVDLGFASPGVDEAKLVSDLIAALHAAAGSALGGQQYPALAAFHVGITRVEGDFLRGAAVIRICELLKSLASTAVPGTGGTGQLVVGISSALFEDIGSECGFTEGWRPLAAAGAWFRVYGTNGSGPKAKGRGVRKC